MSHSYESLEIFNLIFEFLAYLLIYLFIYIFIGEFFTYGHHVDRLDIVGTPG